VVVLGIYKFGGDGILGTSHAKVLACRCSLRVGVATLNHEVLDDTMKECPVIIAFAGKLEEVVTVFGGLVVKAHYDVAIGGTDTYLRCG
jgi:hypothetical protein